MKKKLEYIDIRKNQRGNQQWTIQQYWQHWTQDTGRKQKTKTQHNIRKLSFKITCCNTHFGLIG
jgi:hypothetical protein